MCIIEAPSSTKHREKKRDPKAHSTKKGNNWHFGYKAHIGVDKKTEENRKFTFRLTQDSGYFTNGSVSITVVDENDNPISNALVEMGVQGSSIGDVEAGLLDSQNGTTDSNGIVKLWPKESSLTTYLTVKVTAEGYSEAKYQLNLSTDETEFTFKLTQDDRNDNSDDNNNENIIASGAGGTCLRALPK